VGFFLVDGGRARWNGIWLPIPVFRRVGRFLKRRPLALYLGGIAALTAGPAGAAVVAWLRGRGPGLGLLALWWRPRAFALTRPAISLVNWLATLLVPPRFLPSLDFLKGIPPEHRTIVVVPTFLGPPAASARLLEDLEIRYLANKIPESPFALLTDFPDADAAELCRRTAPGSTRPSGASGG
jgi:cyclic beta-1,2-glucan synthetase